MALNLPESAFTKLNEAILLFNRTCNMVYPERRQTCENCVTNTFGEGLQIFTRLVAQYPLAEAQIARCVEVRALKM